MTKVDTQTYYITGHNYNTKTTKINDEVEDCVGIAKNCMTNTSPELKTLGQRETSLTF